MTKSGETRTRILEAAVECLANLGYAATSTTVVARAANLARSAMLYHFPSRAALIEAVIHYVTRRRVEMQEEAQGHLPRDETFRAKSVESAWAQLQTKEFFAFCELAMAARTDPEIERVFEPALAAFDQARREMALKLSADDLKEAPGFDLRRDVTRFLLEGLTLQGGITFDADRRRAELMAFLKLLYDDGVSAPLLKAAEETAARDLAGD